MEGCYCNCGAMRIDGMDQKKRANKQKMVEKRNDFTQNFLPPIFCFERPFEKLFSLSANMILTYTHVYRNICKQYVKDYDYS